MSPSACLEGDDMRAPVVATSRVLLARASSASVSPTSSSSPRAACHSTRTWSRPKASTSPSRTRRASTTPPDRRARMSGPRRPPVRTMNSPPASLRSTRSWRGLRSPGEHSARSLIAPTSCAYPPGLAAKMGRRIPGSSAPGASPHPGADEPGTICVRASGVAVSSAPYTIGRPTSRAAMVV